MNRPHRRKGNKIPMPDPNNSKQVSFFLDKDVHFAIKMHCEANDRDVSDFFREAAHKLAKGPIHARLKK